MYFSEITNTCTEKKNMKLQVIGEHEYDRSDPRNNGIVADQLAGHSKGRTIRRIIYTRSGIGKDLDPD